MFLIIYNIVTMEMGKKVEVKILIQHQKKNE